jgi:hypothetical protein
MRLTVCPCCGFKFEGDLRRDGCKACGARAVGPPLSTPAQELPFYGRALFVCAFGGVLLVTFLVNFIIALFERSQDSFDFSSIVSAAETTAWRLKWVALPVTIIAIWTGSVICASIRRNPQRFAGSRIAHGGLMASVLVTVLLTTFIGISIPERLRQRQLGLEAATSARLYTLHRAFLEYRTLYGTYPATTDDIWGALKSKALPDPDGSITTALVGVDSNAYSPGADLASLPKKKPRTLRGSALRNASLRSTDDAPEGGLAFTKYELRLPGEDKKLGTEDDWIMRDGMIIKPSPSEEQAAQSANRPDKP